MLYSHLHLALFIHYPGGGSKDVLKIMCQLWCLLFAVQITYCFPRCQKPGDASCRAFPIVITDSQVIFGQLGFQVSRPSSCFATISALCQVLKMELLVGLPANFIHHSQSLCSGPNQGLILHSWTLKVCVFCEVERYVSCLIVRGKAVRREARDFQFKGFSSREVNGRWHVVKNYFQVLYEVFLDGYSYRHWFLHSAAWTSSDFYRSQAGFESRS